MPWDHSLKKETETMKRDDRSRAGLVMLMAGLTFLATNVTHGFAQAHENPGDAPASSDQPHSPASGHENPHPESSDFNPQLFAESYRMTLRSTNRAEACGLIADRPRGRLLFDGLEDGNASGQMYFRNDRGVGWTAVIRDDREAGFYADVWYLQDDHEFLMMDVSCKDGNNGLTSMTVRWRLTGTTDEGNADIKAFFEAGSFEQTWARNEERMQAVIDERRQRDRED
jgi:hypothetical protein